MHEMHRVVANRVDVVALVDRLNEFALANFASRSNRVAAMTGEQLKAAEMLLRKVVPDLQRTALEGGDPNNPVKGVMKLEVEFVEPAVKESNPSPKD